MKRPLRPFFVALMVAAVLGGVLLAAGFGIDRAAAQLQTFAKSDLTIVTASGRNHFTVEEARTREQMAQGLMFRQAMAPDAGMIFEFPHPEVASFWMRNTLIPLDMLFVTGDGTIADFHERAVPLSEAAINSDRAVLAVIELNGGTVARLGIKRGDHVEHPFFAKGG